MCDIEGSSIVVESSPMLYCAATAELGVVLGEPARTVVDDAEVSNMILDSRPILRAMWYSSLNCLE